MFKGVNKARVDLQSLTYLVTYLIRGAIFRPNFYISRLGRSSLDIYILGELIDIYYAYKATKQHNKIFALLGISSNNLSKINLLLDYSIP